MLAVIGLAVGYRSRSSHKSLLILASIAVALMAARRLNNAIVAWTDLMDLVFVQHRRVADDPGTLRAVD